MSTAVGYKDPAQERLSNGMAVSDLMRNSSAGLEGVIIPPSTSGGVPVNFDPSGYTRMPIHIDPDNPDGPVLTLAAMGDVDMTAVIEAATTKYPGGDINSVRNRAMYTMMEIAKNTKEKTANTPSPASSPGEIVRDSAVPPHEQEITIRSGAESRQKPGMPVEKINRNYSPMAAFGLREQRPEPAPVGRPTMESSQPDTVSAPQTLVYFEKEGIGTVPAFFHDVLVLLDPGEDENLAQTGFMVLVYNLGFIQSAARWFPPADDPYQRPWAVQISGDERLHLVDTTGFQYTYAGIEYCILRISQSIVCPGNAAGAAH